MVIHQNVEKEMPHKHIYQDSLLRLAYEKQFPSYQHTPQNLSPYV